MPGPRAGPKADAVARWIARGASVALAVLFFCPWVKGCSWAKEPSNLTGADIAYWKLRTAYDKPLEVMRAPLEAGANRKWGDLFFLAAWGGITAVPASIVGLAVGSFLRDPFVRRTSAVAGVTTLLAVWGWGVCGPGLDALCHGLHLSVAAMAVAAGAEGIAWRAERRAAAAPGGASGGVVG